jgi:hypothetical protein
MIQRPASRTMHYITPHAIIPLFSTLASRSLPRQSLYTSFRGIVNRHRGLYYPGNQIRTVMASMKAANRLKVALEEGKGPSMGCW